MSKKNINRLAFHFCGIRFPKFWISLQEELDVGDEDLTQVKSVFTFLGFMTQSSISSIKTSKKLSDLETEYIKQRSNANNLEELCRRFPSLKTIDSFTSGMMATMMGIIAHLNPKKNQLIEEMDDETQKTLHKTIFEQSKKVFLRVSC